MTTNPLIDFLASYGPQASGKNMYDEFVVAAAKEMGCAQIVIEQPLVDDLTNRLVSVDPRSVILTGTAGDGKTYTARKVLERLSKGTKEWGTTDKELNYDQGGRRIRFIKDLSELNDKEKDKLFPDVCASFMDNSDDVFVICVNDGHLLKFFRDQRDCDNEERKKIAKKLHSEIVYMLQSENEASSNFKLDLINMSRQDNADLVNAIIDAVVGHEGWDGCAGCPVQSSSVHPCPIQTNMNLLGERGDPSLRARLQDMVRMASTDGKHMSIRQLLLLVVNIILGDSKRGSRGADLMNCRRAKIRAKKSEYEFTNPYANVFGDNLPKNQRFRYEAFTILGDFGVGFETNNYFDHGIVRGSSYLPDHPVYGDRIFKLHRERYKADAEDGLDAFFTAIISQRRRLFFSVEENGDDVRKEPRRSPWNLTVYKHGASHCKLIEEGGGAPKQDIKDIRRKIILGLNRMMSGYMTRTDDRLWIVEPFGIYRGQEIPLVVGQAGQEGQGNTTLRFPKVDKGTPPLIEVEVDGNVKPIPLKLRPSLTECLIRVAYGALPSSFSSECRREVERFQLAVVTALTESSCDQRTPHLLRMDQGELQASTIFVLSEQEEW